MSAQKQCPKCGEKNPAEAVMCWACYTSLSGGIAGAVPAGGAAAGAMTDTSEKKKIEPKQLAIIGLGLVVVLGLGASTMMGSGEPEEPLPTFTPGGGGGMPSIGGEPTTVKPSEPGVIAPPPQGGGTTPEGPKGPPVVAPPFPYTLAAAPNPRVAWATMAIVPNSGDTSMSSARALAEFAYRYQQKTKKFPAVEIFVITSKQSAQEFAEYQSKNRGARLTAASYQALRTVWVNTPVRYVNVNGKPSYSSPQKDPSGFWTASSSQSQ